MDLTGVLFPTWWRWIGLAIYLLALAWAVRGAPWGWFALSEPVHVWYGGVLALTLLWCIDAPLGSSVSFHLSGLSLFALLVGPRLAFVGGAAVVALVIATRSGTWLNLPLATLVMVGTPVAVTAMTLRMAERWLPANFFVYVFVVAFFGGWMAMLAEGLAAAAALIAGAGAPTLTVIDDYLTYTALLGVGEATLTGMLITLLVVYRPSWVATFDDRRYLRDK